MPLAKLDRCVDYAIPVDDCGHVGRCKRRSAHVDANRLDAILHDEDAERKQAGIGFDFEARAKLDVGRSRSARLRIAETAATETNDG